MNFSCEDRSSVSNMMKNDEILMDLDRLVEAYWKIGVRRSSVGKISDFDRNSDPVLVQVPVEWV